MPFTPFHMGPGLLLKALLQGYFSLVVFGWAQFLMDLQPLFALLTGYGQLHGFSHTYAGATLIAVIAAWSGRWVYRLVQTFADRDFTDFQKRLFDVPASMTRGVLLASAFIGTFSHVVLDSIMHADMAPFFPLDIDNRLLLIMSIETLHAVCIALGLAGAAIYFALRLHRPRK